MIKKMYSVVQYRKTLLQRKRLLWIQAYSEESLLPILNLLGTTI